MSEGSTGGGDSRSEEELTGTDEDNPGAKSASAADPGPDQADPGSAPSAAQSDTYTLYQRGLDLLGRGSAAAAAQLLQRAATAEPHSRSILEALARAQFDAGRYAAAAESFRRIVEASPADDYAQFGLGLALARTGDPGAAAEHLALAAAMRPNLQHYTDALRSVRATLNARNSTAHRMSEGGDG
jgi:tetratricopeptide (TPR) repeat protein